MKKVKLTFGGVLLVFILLYITYFFLCGNNGFPVYTTSIQDAEAKKALIKIYKPTIIYYRPNNYRNIILSAYDAWCAKSMQENCFCFPEYFRFVLGSYHIHFNLEMKSRYSIHLVEELNDRGGKMPISQGMQNYPKLSVPDSFSIKYLITYAVALDSIAQDTILVKFK